MDLLITKDEIAIPMTSGNAKQKAWRNLAGPDDRDSATNGKTNAARVAATQITALVAINFFFSDGVMAAILNLAKGCQEYFSSWRANNPTGQRN
jgi:hypothetical protein